MSRSVRISSIAVLALALSISGANAQQGGVGQGAGRKHQQSQTDAAKPTAQKADEKAYNAALKSLPNKSYDPWAGTR
jgi:hypothetical protein